MAETKTKKPTDFTHLRVHVQTKKRLEQLKAIGQSFDGFLQELMNKKEEK